MWFDPDVNRIKYNDQGDYLGEFESSDRILVILPSEQTYTTDFGESNHFAESPKVIEKYDPDKVWSVIYTTPEGVTYIKRVYLEEDGLRLVSINKKYKDKFAPYDDDPRIVGKIVGNFMPLED